MKSRLQILSTPLSHLSIIQRIIVRLLFFLFAFLIKVEREDRIPPASYPMIYAFNHNSSYETILVLLFLLLKHQGKRIHFVVDWMYGYIPIVGWLVRQTEPIFVYRKPARLRFLNQIKLKIEQKNVYLQCFQKLQQDQSIGIFPEGTRNRNPEALKMGQRGIGKLALKTGISVFPIGIDFPKRIKYGKIPKFGKLILRAGDILTFTEEKDKINRIVKSSHLPPAVKIELIKYYEIKVTYDIMLELARLSGKSYPFNPPRIPRRIERNLDKTLVF